MSIFVVYQSGIKLMKDQVAALNNQFKEATAEEMLKYFSEKFPSVVAFASSLSKEDQIITSMLAQFPHDIHCFTLDTGRLFQETYNLLDITIKKYHLDIHLYFPDAARVEEMVNAGGVNLFYSSVENRKKCCHIRKIEPLQRALKGKKIWINGLRRAQSVTREALSAVEWDESFQVLKVNPLWLWTDQDVDEFIAIHKIPYNPMHDQGFPSIGCQPCTRAILPGEDTRAGRWWWEQAQQRECGLHTHDKSI